MGNEMNDTSPGEHRVDETAYAATRQVAASDWNRAEIEAQPAPPAPRERLFSRKVMIGWALFAIAAYFGVQVAKNAVKASVRQAVESGALRSATQTKDRIVIETPNGTRVTIRRERPGPSVKIDRQTPPVIRTTPTTSGRTAPASSTAPPTATGDATAPAAASAIPPELKKR